MTPEHRFTLPELIELMHKHRLTHIKLGSMELEMSPSAFAADAVPDAKGDAWNITYPTPEAFLTASMPDSMFDTPVNEKKEE